MRTILILGDGPNELGTEWEKLLQRDELPALARLVHRLLGEPSDMSYSCRLFRRIVHARGRGTGFSKKTKAALILARQLGHAALVIVVDRDGDRRKFPSLAEARSETFPAAGCACALGQAIETFDAWMIADGKAIGEAGGDASRSHPEPEKLDGKEGTGRHPKDRAVEVFGSRRVLTEKYAIVACHVNLEQLKNSCPKGFAPFAEEIREHVLTILPEE